MTVKISGWDAIVSVDIRDIPYVSRGHSHIRYRHFGLKSGASLEKEVNKICE